METVRISNFEINSIEDATTLINKFNLKENHYETKFSIGINININKYRIYNEFTLDNEDSDLLYSRDISINSFYEYIESLFNNEEIISNILENASYERKPAIRLSEINITKTINFLSDLKLLKNTNYLIDIEYFSRVYHLLKAINRLPLLDEIKYRVSSYPTAFCVKLPFINTIMYKNNIPNLFKQHICSKKNHIYHNSDIRYFHFNYIETTLQEI